MAQLLAPDGKLPGYTDWDQPPVSAENLERFHLHLQETMTDIGFYDPDNPKQLLTRLRRLFNRVRLDEMEVSILRGLLSAAQRISHSK